MAGDVYVLPDGRTTAVCWAGSGSWYVVDQIYGLVYPTLVPSDHILYYVADSNYTGGNFLKLDVRPGPVERRQEFIVVPYQLPVYGENLIDLQQLIDPPTDSDSYYDDPASGLDEYDEDGNPIEENL